MGKSGLLLILASIFNGARSKHFELHGGLVLSYKYGEKRFSIGRVGVYPSPGEIEVIVRLAAECGVKLNFSPELDRMKGDDGREWFVCAWQLEVTPIEQMIG
jgi:hypothetical protein